MAIYKEDIIDIELETGSIQRGFLNHTIGTGDALANWFGVRLFRNGEPVSAESAVVSGVFMAPDGTNYGINETSYPGSTWKSGNAAAVCLPDVCYAVTGQFCLAIKLSGGDVNSTVRIIDGTVCETGEAGAVVPTSTIPTTEEIIAAYEEAVEVVGGSVRFDVTQSLSESEQEKARGNIGAAGSDELEEVSEAVGKANLYTEYSDDQLGSYAGSIFEQPYEKRIIGFYRTGTVQQYDESYSDTSARAILKIKDPLIVDGTIYAVNPNKYPFGIYYRKKSDNEYVGYAQPVTTVPVFKVTGLDISTYDYYALIVHYSGGSETYWTAKDLDLANRRICLYSGEYVDLYESLSFHADLNMIKPDMIHTGKYYYGESAMGTNEYMAYTDLIPVKAHKTYYMPYVTLGWSWYESDQETVIGGDYVNVESTANRNPYTVLEAPAGAAYIGVSVRTGDVPNMILAEVPVSRTRRETSVSPLVVTRSNIVKEELNWLYNTDFRQNRGGSRLTQQGSGAYDGSKVTLGTYGTIFSYDQVAMDKSKVSIIFSVPDSGTPEFVVGYNGYYALTPLAISDGALGVAFPSDGQTAQIRMGTGESGNYATLLKTVDISALNIHSGRKFVCSIEKNTISKWIVSIYDALTPDAVVTETIEGHVSQSDENLYTGQIRGWGGPFIRSISGTIEVWNVQMYSTAPAYPKIAIWGDSYVENMGRNPNCAYGNLLRNELDGNVFLSGQGGATAEQTSRRVASEITTCSPQHIIFNVGVNDSFNVTAATFKEQIGRLINMAKIRGAEPILITVPRINDGTLDNESWVAGINPWIRSSGYRYIDIAYALSTGDGIAQDYNKFVGDKTHPNLAGGQAIFNYIKAFLPDLLWK